MREVVTQPLLGQIRLQWWRDALDEITLQNTPRAHFVVTRLAEAMQRHPIDRRLLAAMIDAREAQDLAETPPATLGALELYAAATSGGLLQAQLHVLDAADTLPMTAAHHLGIAWGLIGAIRAAPFHASTGRRYIPADLLAEGTQLDFADAAVRDALRTMAIGAAKHLESARAMRRQLPRQALPVMILARPAARYLALLRRAEHDPRALVGPGHPAVGAIGMLWSSLTGRY